MANNYCTGCTAELMVIAGNPVGMMYCSSCSRVQSTTNTGMELLKGEAHTDQEKNDDRQFYSSTIQNPKSRSVMKDSESQVWLNRARAKDQTETSFAQTLTRVTEIVIKLSLQLTVAKHASKICQGAFQQSIIRGSSLGSIAAASVYASTKQLALGVTVEEISESTGLRRQEILHTFRKLQSHLHLKFQSVPPNAYADRIAIALHLSSHDRIAEDAYSVLSKASGNQKFQGRHPAAIAAGAIYIAMKAAGYKVTQREIARASFITETSVRNAFEDISKHLKP